MTMKKEAIIDIIINDLKEIELLLQNFKYGENIEGAFIDLLHSKQQNISKEIALLDFWRNDEKQVPHIEAPKTPAEEAPKALAVEPEPQVIKAVEPEPVKESVAIVEQPAVVAEPEPVVEQVVAPEPEPAPMPEPVAEPVAVNKVADAVVTATKPNAAETITRQAKGSDVKNYGTPVSDIKKAIAIADRFLFQKELFGGDANEFNSAINRANEMTSYEEAESHFLSNYGWDIENKTVEAFLKAVHRKFI